ncbi:MAG: HAMP domain-containing histidine kinase [Acidimicrobiaceae bacterium]|nr:HAMP domain-containing histidine kinase [Acidimicrobiaceae bacterium]
MRLALAYGAMFLVCGAALLAISYFFVVRFPFGATVHITSGSGTASAGPSNIAHPTLPSRGSSPSGTAKSPPPGYRVSAGSVHAAVNAQHAADLHSLLVWFGVALAVMALVSVLLGWAMGARVLRPLRQITTTARHISEENLQQRLALAGPSDEITDLADTIDALLARLEGAFDAERAFVANASHELRTPLAMIRTSLDVAAAKSPPISSDAAVLSGKVREGLGQAERLVESFLVLARAQRGMVDDLTPVSLPEIADQILDARADAAAAANVTLCRNLEVASVTGSRTLLTRLIANLVDNAIKHNQPGGWVHLTTTGAERDVRLVVENSGLVLEPTDVAQLARPFQRGGAERTASDGGFGLGLSIVAAIAAAHAGAVELEPRPQGGLRVSVSLPRSLLDRQSP